MVRLSAIALGLLCGLSNTLGVVADSTTITDPNVDGTIAIGFPGVNITDILAQAENQLGVNGTVTDSLPPDAGAANTTVIKRDLEEFDDLRKRTFNSAFVLCNIACVALKILFPSKVALQGSSNYNSWNNPSFWSSTTYMTPTCVFQPASEDDLSLAMRIIYFSQSDFNIVGGGHSAIKGWANVEDGVLITFANMTGVNLKSGYAEVAAGERWGTAFTALDNAKLMAAGGRMSSVGVSGLTLGGGISYLSNQYGFVTDQVKNFRVVLYNGCVVDANKNTNPDLFRALKGGSSNFGIVVRFDLNTFPCPAVYAGQLYYSDVANDFPKLFTAIYNYHKTGVTQDIKTHLISAFVYIGAAQMHLGAFTAFRNVATADAGLALAEVLAINPAVTSASTLKLRSYGSMAIELGSGDVNGLRQDMRDFSAYVNKDMYKIFWDYWRAGVAEKFASVSGFMATIAFQPISKVAVAAGVATGGNSLGLEKNTDTMVIINITTQWADLTKDADILAALDSLLAQCIAKAKLLGVSHPYYYLNYARKQDNPIGSYGTESLKRLRAASAMWDPSGVFQKRVPGGFKIPA
ncbi:hypothetical protein H072_10559 [Dactylellina haptotyla CBS 200.50]|uniref:FAD-binding PCMH-type domain-containing protein n=1 Tax=Dactylellina haptotyla (strain CBS 200.50) TaxID=1284197 RepID=S7ZZS5_DACHA|nr:hypothetical protein H072_10559 [Dactylellina haptotyla CBS 200.50]